MGQLTLALLALSSAVSLGACSDEHDWSPGAHEFGFGPYTVQSGEEREWDCVQISLENPETVYVNTVELTTGPGFHHSNWLYVPEHIFPGPDGTYPCDDRGYSEAVAAVFGGVIFAQSTQSTHEVQAFSPGVVVKLPPRSKLVAQLHLLNTGDEPLKLSPKIALATIPEAEVATQLTGVSFQNMALALPARRESRFTLECEIAEKHRQLLGRDPDFNLYYGLAHYHDLGTNLTLEAVRPDGTATTVYSTETRPGDTLGGPIAPIFNMSGYSKLRFACDFYNPRAQVVEYGFGDGEMCVFLAFSDSPYIWGGGVNEPEAPLNETVVGNAFHYSNPCTVFASDGRR